MLTKEIIILWNTGNNQPSNKTKILQGQAGGTPSMKNTDDYSNTINTYFY